MVMNVCEQIIIGLSIKVVLMHAFVVPAIYSGSTYTKLSLYLNSHDSYQTFYNSPSMT